MKGNARRIPGRIGRQAFVEDTPMILHASPESKSGALPALELELPVAFFKHKQDNVPQRRRLAWPDLVKLLTTHERRDEKDGPLFSPVEYRPGATRGNAGVLAVSAVVFDFDDGTRPEEVEGRWHRWEYVIYSTHRHTETGYRWRVVFPLLRAIPAEEWPAAYRRLAAELADGHADPSCKDLARLFYLPSSPPGGDAFALHHEGQLLDPDELPNPDPPAPPPSRVEYSRRPGDERPDADRLVRMALDRMPGGRDNACFWLACQLRDNGYTQGEAEAIAQGFARLCPTTDTKGHSDPFTEQDAIRRVRSAYSGPAREPWGRTVRLPPPAGGNGHRPAAAPEVRPEGPAEEPVPGEPTAGERIEAAIKKGTPEAVYGVVKDLASLDAASFGLAMARIRATCGKSLNQAEFRAAIAEAKGTANTHAPSQATIAVDLTFEAGVELFHTPDGEPYMSIRRGGHRETFRIGSNGSRDYVTRLFYDARGSAPGGKATQDAINVLTAKAMIDGPEREVFIRVGSHGAAAYYDLGDPTWRAVEVTAAGWRVVEEPPVYFRRAPGMLPLPEPVRGGSLSELRQFVNIEAEEWPLCAGYLAGMARPTGPYPVLGILGEQGSAKTTFSLVLRNLIDPNTAGLRSAPRDVRDLVIAGKNGWVIAYNNLSGMPDWLSDALARVATGAGFGTRMLHTDGDEALFYVRRPIILNGIGEVASRADLLDRMVLLHLQPIPDERRREEAAFWREFEEARPRLLGSLFDAVATALRRFPEAKLDKLPRMADFARWGHAAEPAFGVAPGAFLEAYNRNRGEANAIAIDASLVAGAVRALVDAQAPSTLTDPPVKTWKGTMKNLLEALEELLFTDRTDPEKPTRKRTPKEWPANARALSLDLKRCATPLRSEGYLVDVRSTKKGAFVTLATTCKPDQATEGDANDSVLRHLASPFDFASPFASPEEANNGAGFSPERPKGDASDAKLHASSMLPFDGRKGEKEESTPQGEHLCNFASPASPASPGRKAGKL